MIARGAVARGSPVMSATALRVSGPRSSKAVTTVSPRARDSMNPGPRSCLEAAVQEASGPASRAGRAGAVATRSAISPAAARSRGSRSSRSAAAVWRLVWLTTLSAHAGASAGSGRGTARATSPGSISWSSSIQPSWRAVATRLRNASSDGPGRGGRREALAVRILRPPRAPRLPLSGAPAGGEQRPGAVRSAGSRSPTRKLSDMARRRVAWWTKRMASPSGTARETDSSSSSASRSARSRSSSGRRRAAR